MFGPGMMELEITICTNFACRFGFYFPNVGGVGTVNEAFILSMRHFADVEYHDRILE